MRVFKDIVTECEIISDSYPWTTLFDGAVAEVQSRMIVPQKVKVDIGCGNAFGAKKEEVEEGLPVDKVNDLIDDFDYKKTTLDIKAWQGIFNGFVDQIMAKKIKYGATAEQIVTFKKNAGAYRKYINEKWDDLTAYIPKDLNKEHSYIFSYRKNKGDEAPVFIFYLDGCSSFKV